MSKNETSVSKTNPSRYRKCLNTKLKFRLTWNPTHDMSHDFLNLMCSVLRTKNSFILANGPEVDQNIDYTGYTLDWRSSWTLQ